MGILQVIHEGTTNVKRIRIKILTHEYEMYRTKHEENIHYIIKWFIDIVNRLRTLVKTSQNEYLIQKPLDS